MTELKHHSILTNLLFYIDILYVGGCKVYSILYFNTVNSLIYKSFL